MREAATVGCLVFASYGPTERVSTTYGVSLKGSEWLQLSQCHKNLTSASLRSHTKYTLTVLSLKLPFPRKKQLKIAQDVRTESRLSNSTPHSANCCVAKKLNPQSNRGGVTDKCPGKEQPHSLPANADVAAAHWDRGNQIPGEHRPVTWNYKDFMAQT